MHKPLAEQHVIMLMLTPIVAQSYYINKEWGCDGKKVGVYKKEHLCYAS